MICDICGKELQHRDYVSRRLKYGGGRFIWIKMERRWCKQCKIYRRVYPKFIYPYKHYDGRIIFGVRHGRITSSTLGYEDYPCEMTMARWVK